MKVSGRWNPPSFLFTKKNTSHKNFGGLEKNVIFKKSDGVFQSISTEINDLL